ncbi:hypothetical protein NKH71_03390 [Mesorhizobium sp. M0983]|uniref:hypothetical protein n=1 Tax=Mesorhizobium sp. M0983 TaxID=2957040 RepID=UPI00333936A6
MTGEYDGVYSVVASAIGGSSIATIKIKDGRLVGNDLSGSRYQGTLAGNGDETVTFDLEVSMPPNVFGIWGTSASETVQTRAISVPLPASVFDGIPFKIPSFEMILIFRRISEDYASLAGPDGFQILIGTLADVQKSWEAFDNR